MKTFSNAEREYLAGRRLARLATVDEAGQPHVVPIGMWQLDPQLGTVDVTGRDFGDTRKFRNVEATGSAALVVDDMASIDPWRPRAVMISGPAEAIRPADGEEALIRITPERILSWGIEPGT